MIRYDLEGKTALVTGGASGIGFATATLLASAPWAFSPSPVDHAMRDPAAFPRTGSDARDRPWARAPRPVAIGARGDLDG